MLAKLFIHCSEGLLGGEGSLAYGGTLRSEGTLRGGGGTGGTLLSGGDSYLHGVRASALGWCATPVP